MPTQRPTRYTALAQGFHWIIAALIVIQFTLAWTAEDLPLGARKLGLLARHKSVGMTVLMLAVLRLLWRLKHPAPPLPPGPDNPRCLLRAAVRDASHRVDDVLRKELLGQLVRLVHLAEPHWQERGRLRLSACDA
jgi:hypothetical protein